MRKRAKQKKTGKKPTCDASFMEEASKKRKSQEGNKKKPPCSSSNRKQLRLLWTEKKPKNDFCKRGKVLKEKQKKKTQGKGGRTMVTKHAE